MSEIADKISLVFKDSFFEEENRCEYIVTKKTKKIWAIQLDLLDKLLKVCNKHDIRVSVFAGTLLGAIRHKGFIPWDDDIDVCMDRDNYQKLLLHLNEFQFPYFLQTAYNDRDFFFGYARLRNSLSTAIVKWEKSESYNSGIFIDIFVLDGYSYDEEILQRQLKWKSNLERIISIYHWKYSKGKKQMIKKMIYYLLFQHIPYEKILSEYDRCISSQTGATDRLTFMTHIPQLAEKYWCYKSNLSDLIWVPFENLMVPVPREYDWVLKNIYGDYMAFPPLESRGAWHKNIITFEPDIPYKEYYSRFENE